MAKKKNKKSSPKKNTTKKQFSLIKFIFKWGFVAGLWGLLALGGILLWFGKDLPELTKKAAFERKHSIIVKDMQGDVIARYGDVKGDNLTVDDLPPHLVNAVLAIEDRRFYSHFGIDPFGIARAMVTNLRRKGFVQGGSTITQQLAKNLFLSRERKLTRKIQEAMLAVWLESQLSKDEILSAYLNRVYLGSGTYGVDAAANLYFGKSARDVNLTEAAILAGLLKAPSRYSPLNNPALAKDRAHVVLDAMEDAGFLEIDNLERVNAPAPRPRTKPSKGEAVRYYTDWVVDNIDDLIGTPAQDLIIETTLDPVVQSKAEGALIKSLQENGEARHITEGAVVIMGLDGRVLSMVGGRDYNKSQFNRAAQAKRQPGSSFKPFVYLTALEQGWHPYDPILDEPFTEGSYKPKNFGNEYMGEVDLMTAMTYSLNTAAVRLMDYTGRENVIKTAQKLGIQSELQPDLSLALGSSAVSLLEMVTAYTHFANGGEQVHPYAITKITTKDGDLLYERVHLRGKKIIDDIPLNQINMMFNSVAENGTGRGAQMGYQMGGKTGTSQNSRDAWFLGFTNALAGGVWMGNDNNTHMKSVTGGSFPARIWGDIMRTAHLRYQHTAERPIFDVDIAEQKSGDREGINSLLGRILGRYNSINWNAPRMEGGVKDSGKQDAWGFND